MKSRIVVIFFILMLTGSVFSQSLEDNKRIVKVLTFNILHGATTVGDFNLDNIAKVILEADPDLVAMQEVDFLTNRAKKYDLVTELAIRTKMAPLFARAMPYDGGEYGEGILSKWSFVSSRNVPLPYTEGNEPRAAAEIVTVMPSGDTIAFVGTHFDHLKNGKDRLAQANKINEVFSMNKYPTILAGDLNAQPESLTIRLLKNIWTVSDQKDIPSPTMPSANPKSKIDYIMYKPQNKWKVLRTEVIQDEIASDHCAYLVTLELLNTL
jgi:endonuclease/exonuclease/phosphatase family metal-dependent hydrolase